jgi:hypothetical protein
MPARAPRSWSAAPFEADELALRVVQVQAEGVNLLAGLLRRRYQRLQEPAGAGAGLLAGDALRCELGEGADGLLERDVQRGGHWADILQRLGQVGDLTLRLSRAGREQVGDVRDLLAGQTELGHGGGGDAGRVGDVDAAGGGQVQRPLQRAAEDVAHPDPGLAEGGDPVGRLGGAVLGGGAGLDRGLPQLRQLGRGRVGAGRGPGHGLVEVGERLHRDADAHGGGRADSEQVLPDLGAGPPSLLGGGLGIPLRLRGLLSGLGAGRGLVPGRLLHCGRLTACGGLSTGGGAGLGRQHPGAGRFAGGDLLRGGDLGGRARLRSRGLRSERSLLLLQRGSLR